MGFDVSVFAFSYMSYCLIFHGGQRSPRYCHFSLFDGIDEFDRAFGTNLADTSYTSFTNIE